MTNQTLIKRFQRETDNLKRELHSYDVEEKRLAKKKEIRTKRLKELEDQINSLIPKIINKQPSQPQSNNDHHDSIAQ